MDHLTAAVKERMARPTKEWNQEIGDKLRRLRLLRGLSQEKLGKILGVTFQQIQKYESGFNAVSLGRLQLCAQALGVTINHFLNVPEIEVPSIDLSDRQLLATLRALQRLQKRRPATFDVVREFIARLAETEAEEARKR
jgi:transcriptional regulator with XRE-family HTH domain